MNMFKWLRKKECDTPWYEHYKSPSVLGSSDKLFLETYEEDEFNRAVLRVCEGKTLLMEKIYLGDGIDLLTGDKRPEDFYFKRGGVK